MMQIISKWRIISCTLTLSWVYTGVLILHNKMMIYFFLKNPNICKRIIFQSYIFGTYLGR